jgi:hypothetical protein
MLFSESRVSLRYVFFAKKTKTTEETPRMFTIHQLLKRFKDDLAHLKKGEERSQWFIYTILAVIFPFNSSKTSNLLRCSP